ncbi:16S rRNA (guanine(527)-N(7))-methyltransferase RsmG [Caulobacter sp. NIBR2454]|uniref:16S rRNA (guanine(527)-N(7))-methyltransferase RsmG n=1 Tax=Caulobacter sp. NIBR2454 TaxID=3015996 RepID=UPI0022B63B0B|nr:16S rRNA (guanine(527)-N(7))-methyltransferase RsmG [Caulobacter sp. NIBR2454]
MSVASAQLDPLQIGVTDAASFQAATGASDQAMADLERFRVLLAEWNEKMNLVGPASLPSFWNRHAWDSAQLLSYAPDARVWADLGAGAGLPGVVLAILLKGQDGGYVHLVESMAKRCRFLSEVVLELDLPAEIHNARAEDLSLKTDIVTARACAPLERLLGYAQPYFKRGATALFLKGQDVASELTEATKYWKFNSDLKPSLSDPRGFVLQVKGLSRARPV